VLHAGRVDGAAGIIEKPQRKEQWRNFYLIYARRAYIASKDCTSRSSIQLQLLAARCFKLHAQKIVLNGELT